MYIVKGTKEADLCPPGWKAGPPLRCLLVGPVPRVERGVRLAEGLKDARIAEAYDAAPAADDALAEASAAAAAEALQGL